MAKTKRRVNLDMTNVESYQRCPEGEWNAKLIKAEMDVTQGSGEDCIKAQFEVISGEAKGCRVFETFSLGEKALWKLKSFLEAAGVKASGKIVLDLDKIEGKTCVIDVILDEYNGQKRAKISGYLKATSKSVVVDADDDEDFDEDDEDEEEEEEVKPTTKKSKPAPAKKTKKPAPEDDEDDDEDEDDEDDEDEDAVVIKPSKPAKKTAAKAKKTVSKKKPEPEDDDEDDWEDDDE